MQPEPQSDVEVQPVVTALQQRVDPLLDIRWEPRAFKRRGVFDALGIKTDDKWEGRWEIIRYETPNLHVERNYCRITLVCELRREGTFPIMYADGEYAPVGMWLVDFMQHWDRAQSHFQKSMDEVWAEHDKAEQIQHNDFTAAHQQAAERVYREHGGGETWMGRGFGKGKRTHTASEPVTP